jgi:hypothetical protein
MPKLVKEHNSHLHAALNERYEIKERPQEDEEVATKKTVSKFAPVGPCSLYTGMREFGYIPQNVLLLAHDVSDRSKAYEKEFSLTEWSHTNIIIDNSLIELGGAVDAQMVFAAASIVKAKVVVLPDVLGDKSASLKATLDAWPNWYWQFRNFEKMVVIQGATMTDWLESCETLARETEPDWIAVPRIAQITPYGAIPHSGLDGVADRLELVKIATRIFAAHNKLPKVHLLGFSDYIYKDLEAARNWNVMSIDSAVPLRQATLGIKNIISTDPGSRGDWWNQAVFLPEMVENCKFIDQVISF